jgi:hypothetical protein
VVGAFCHCVENIALFGDIANEEVADHLQDGDCEHAGKEDAEVGGGVFEDEVRKKYCSYG